MTNYQFQKNLKESLELIDSAETIFITGHKNPDGDCVGSILALTEALKTQNKKIFPFCSDSIPSMFDFLPNTSLVLEPSSIEYLNPRDFDLTIVVDANEWKRTGIHPSKKPFSHKTIFIDHHPLDKSESEGTYLIKDVSCDTAAAGIIICELLKLLKIEINKNIATHLLTAIFTDTGGFQHSNTNPEVMRLASDLMLKGANLSKIAKFTFRHKPVNTLKIWGRALARIKTDPATGMTYSVITKKDLDECGATIDDLSGVASLINTVSESKYTLLLTEYGINKIKGSLRSEEYKGVDVSQIARRFGGGGHKLASGFEIEGKIESEKEGWKII
jgi:phosphoesterase RecJ-like protein